MLTVATYRINDLEVYSSSKRGAARKRITTVLYSQFDKTSSRKILSFLVLGCSALATAHCADAAPVPGKSQISYTGTFKTQKAVSTQGYEIPVVTHPTFISQKLAGNKLRFFVHSMGGGTHNDHVASLSSTVPLKGSEACFRKGAYRLRIKYFPGKVVLTDQGDPGEMCYGVGAGVSGTYFLRNSSVPNFKKEQNTYGDGEGGELESD